MGGEVVPPLPAPTMVAALKHGRNNLAVECPLNPQPSTLNNQLAARLLNENALPLSTSDGDLSCWGSSERI
jgi:hypothetical protein